MTATLGFWNDPQLEQRILEQISLDVPWPLIERFSHLVRLSGSPDEMEAVREVTELLTAFGVPHSVFRPTCLISLPGRATLRTLGPHGRDYQVKTQSFSPSTDGREISGEIAYVPGQQSAVMSDLFSGLQTRTDALNLRGKILLTEGLAMAARGIDFRQLGVIGAIFVNPGERIHEGLVNRQWGAPDLSACDLAPAVPILAINRRDGDDLVQQLRDGKVEGAFSTENDVGWRPIPVIVAEIKGMVYPEEFVLLHGHIDSWHVGVSDNATGDATLVEMARVFWANRECLLRSLRVAWWSGHSHGHYAGSTWYADAFAVDLMEHCVSHVNCDSPGSRGATVYENIMRTAEADDLVKNTIKDVTGQESTRARLLRIGDCSFNNIGIPTYFMLSSTIPANLAAEKGYYPVGGSGGNVAWHTEDDTMEIADPANLLRDAKVYATAIIRSLNAPVHPFNFRASVDEMSEHVLFYADAAEGKFDFTPALSEIASLRAALERFYQTLERIDPADSLSLRAANAIQRTLARRLVSMSYSREGRFRQDPVHPLPPLPELYPATRLGQTETSSHAENVFCIELTRGQNHLVWACRSARKDVETFLYHASAE